MASYSTFVIKYISSPFCCDGHQFDSNINLLTHTKQNTNALTRTHAYTCMPTHVHTHIHARTHTHAHTHTHTYTHTHTRAHMHAHTRAHTHTHTHTGTHYTHMCTRTLIFTYTSTCTCTHKSRHTCKSWRSTCHHPCSQSLLGSRTLQDRGGGYL